MTLASLTRDDARAAPKQALLVALRHDHPWRGELLFAASDTPFADGFLHREHAAHPRLLDVLLDETTSKERLVLSGIDLEAPEPLPPLAPYPAWDVASETLGEVTADLADLGVDERDEDVLAGVATEVRDLGWFAQDPPRDNRSR